MSEERATARSVGPLLAGLRGRLIVSCQALHGEPMYGSVHMAAMARAAIAGGAVAIRANTPDDVAAIRAAVGAQVPVIGLWKQEMPPSPVYITPTVAAAQALRQAGATIIAVDATARPRPEGGDVAGYLALLRAALDCPVMADVATLEEGKAAAEAGAALVATTMAGYTSPDPPPPVPDLALLAVLVAALGPRGVPVVAEGRISTPAQARQALAAGAWSVVVGGAITRPQAITAGFVAALRDVAG